MSEKLINGDLLTREKEPFLHVGVYNDGKVAHIYPGSTLKIEPIEVFSQNQPLRVIRKTNIEYEKLMERFAELSARATPYSALANNCEHNANYLLHGHKESPQLQIAAITSLIGAISARRHGWPGILLGGLAAGIAGVTIYNANRQYAF